MIAPALSSLPSMPSVSQAMAGDAAEAFERQRQGEQEFGVAPAPALAAHRDGGLAAGDNRAGRREGLPMQRDLPGYAGVDQRHVARLAFEIAENAGREAGLARPPRAASSEPCGVAMRMFSTRAKIVSPGFGVSQSGLARCASTAAGASILYLAMTASASCRVVASGTVGPEAMTERSSPGTSEIMSATTRAGAAARRAARP